MSTHASAPNKRFGLPGRTLAAPSWVLPGTIWENCIHLADQVDEVGLLFFDEAASLSYATTDLPQALAALPLRYHIHLPLDITRHSPQQAAQLSHKLVSKVTHLEPRYAVLHPPAANSHPAAYMRDFCRTWESLGNKNSFIFLENTRKNDLLSLQSLISATGLGVCLDLGHLLAYRQYAILQRDRLLEHTGLLHLNAPGAGADASKHLPLTALDKTSETTARSLCRNVPDSCTVMLELFSLTDILLSYPILRSWFS